MTVAAGRHIDELPLLEESVVNQTPLAEVVRPNVQDHLDGMTFFPFTNETVLAAVRIPLLETRHPHPAADGPVLHAAFCRRGLAAGGADLIE